jgi:hypothetical protein
MAAPAPQTVACAIRGPISRADLPGLSRRACRLLDRTGAEVLVCDVSGLGPDAVAVEALARLELAVRRRGCHARFRSAPKELLGLLDFMGLRDVLPV